MTKTDDGMDVRVYYEDTDFSGVVYHTSYLRFLERGRTEYLRARGIHQQSIMDGGNGTPFAFAVRRMNIEFVKAARMDDMLRVETRAGDMGSASLTIDQRILRGQEVLLTAHVVVACVAGGRAVRIPHWVRDMLAG